MIRILVYTKENKMSAFRLFQVGMTMEKGGKTFVIVSAMNRAHATQMARQQHPEWRCTGEIKEL